MCQASDVCDHSDRCDQRWPDRLLSRSTKLQKEKVNMSRSIAVLKLSARIKDVISFAQQIATAMTGNAYFPTPNPPLSTLEADVAALNTAEAAVLSRVKGAAEARNSKLATVRSDLEVLRTYVQSIADAANPTNAEAIIESSGLAVRKTAVRNKPALAAKQGSVSGSVNVAAKSAGSRAAYDWQYSTDQKTWTSLPPTLQAKTGVSGLTAGTLYYFRVQPLTKDGEQNFSEIVSLIVS
jgi:hypothetical protein